MGDVTRFINGRAYSQDELLQKGKYPVLRVGNFNTNDSWYYSDLELPAKQYANSGDLLYTWATAFGPHVWQGGKVIYHYHIWKVEIGPDLTRDFALQILERNSEDVLHETHGSTMVHITKADIESKDVSLPAISEQSRIGEFFQKLDALIAANQRKCDLLKQLKQAYLQKLFPAPRETVPKLRFPGFSDAWKQRRLGDVGDMNPQASLPDVFEYVDLESVVGTSLVGHRTESRVTSPSRAQRLAQIGDVFFQLVRPYQRNNFLFELPFTDYVFSTGYAQIRPQCDGRFLFNQLQRDPFVAEVLNRCTGTSYPAISSSDLAEIEVRMPNNLGEQAKIGVMLTALDHLITRHQRRCHQMEELKRAYLQRMFV